MAGRLVGREREVAELRAGIDRARAGHSQLFLLTGEAGIGKSRLGEECARIASAADFLIAWGRAWEAGGAPAYWPWIEALRKLVRAPAAGAVLRDLGPIVRELGPLVPEVAGAAEPIQGLDADQARFRLFDAVATFLARLAAVTPIAILLEDLHAADRPSLLLLEFVARAVRDAPVCIIGTYRELEARLSVSVSDVLARAARHGLVVALERLDDAGVRELLDQIEGVEVTPATQAEVCRTTEGNPLFVEEIGRMLARGASTTRLPPGVREVTRARLAALDAATRSLLAQASIFGRTVELEALSELTGRDADVLQHALADAVAIDILHPVAGARIFAFGHILIREALYGELAPGTRADLHRQAGEALERRWAAAPELHLSELAHHFLEAAAGRTAAAGEPTAGRTAAAGDTTAGRTTDKAIGYALRAADQAMHQLAFDDAARLRERSLALLDARDKSAAGQRADVLRAVAEARLRSGDIANGKAAAVLAAEAARSLGDAQRLAAAALVYATEFVPGAREEVMVVLLREALGAIGEAPTAVRAKLLARLASALLPAADPLEPMALAEEALVIARGLGDREVLLTVLHNANTGLAFSVDMHRRLALRREAVELAVAFDRRAIFPRERGFLVMAQLCAGEVSGALRDIAELERNLTDLSQPRFAHWPSLLRAGVASPSGRFAEARRYIDEAHTISARTNPEFARVPLLFAEIGLQFLRGDIAAIERQRERFLAAADAMQVMGFRPFLLALIGELEGAREAVQRVPPGLVGSMLPPTALLAETLVALADVERTAKLYDVLVRYAREDVMWGVFGMVCIGPTTRVLGCMATLLGRWDDAAAHFADALVRVERSGYHAVHVRLLADEAVLCDRRAAEGDAARARSLRMEAIARARSLDMAAFADRLALLIQGVPAPAVPVAAAPARFITLVRDGDGWRLTAGGVSLRIQDGLGVAYLDHLIRHAGEDVHVLTLAGLGREPLAAADAGALLDDKAKAAYRARVATLRATVDEATAWNDTARAEVAQREIDTITAELARAIGLGGRDRRASSPAERARVNVQRRLRDTLARIAQHDPDLGRYLQLAVRTGTYCVFVPTGV